MSKTFNTIGIVLRRYDYRENDRLFVIFTKDYGKIDVVAKGTKKILSKLNPHLEPFNEVKIMVAKGKGFDKLGNAIAVNQFSNLKTSRDVGRLASVQYMLEATEKLMQHRFPEDRIYTSLLEGLQFANDSLGEEKQMGHAFFLANTYILKLLDQLGYRPQLTRCVECHKGVLFPEQTYDFLRGGLVCESCKQITLLHDHYTVSDAGIKILQIVLDEPYINFERYRFNPQDMNDFNTLCTKLLVYQIERPLTTLQFIRDYLQYEKKIDPIR